MKVIGCVIEKMHKNGQMGAHGLNWKIFVKSEVRFAIYDKNYPRKKNLRFLGRFWNFAFSTWTHATYRCKIALVCNARMNKFYSNCLTLLSLNFIDSVDSTLSHWFQINKFIQKSVPNNNMNPCHFRNLLVSTQNNHENSK